MGIKRGKAPFINIYSLSPLKEVSAKANKAIPAKMQRPEIINRLRDISRNVGDTIRWIMNPVKYP